MFIIFVPIFSVKLKYTGQKKTSIPYLGYKKSVIGSSAMRDFDLAPNSVAVNLKNAHIWQRCSLLDIHSAPVHWRARVYSRARAHENALCTMLISPMQQYLYYICAMLGARQLDLGKPKLHYIFWRLRATFCFD